MTALSIVLWNIEFRDRHSRDGRELRARIEECEPDLVCITEGHPDFLDLPHTAVASANYGYPNGDGRLKVMLWSRAPWRNIDAVGDHELPPGRYVSATTETRAGTIRVHGICIPWAQAHVRSGRRDRRPWDEHRQFVAGLGRMLRSEDPSRATLVLGDYNQRLPRRYTPVEVHRELQAAFPSSLRCATEGAIEPLRKASIDHLHHSLDLEVAFVRSLSNVGPSGRPLSDHFGLHIQLRRAGSR
ncbi:endonuclease/exonuclease/phosphatase family protein [Neoroseomonas oryzicola]|uniref:Endonuclease/exonuclease/phosphatase family protein n=1 Tax=Neoroseomonas oryzicola TaxID=535904 RepID=A0A9X9WJG6_9PROT|nr:endonuclease/exonuclease/phosphatase family protein [Neoroseomonas oryzicola]NKE18244.1 endonuclease/exonuclease/phosphatase family protein [Neoroseomonas oryzicola]